MEYLSGCVLLDDLKKDENYNLYIEMALYTLIRFIYLTGKIHGDIKGDNIMISTKANYFKGFVGKAILIDFGSSEDMIKEEYNLFLTYYNNNFELLIVFLSKFPDFRALISMNNSKEESEIWKSVYNLLIDRGEINPPEQDNKVFTPTLNEVSDEMCKEIGYNCNSRFTISKPKCLEKCKNKLTRNKFNSIANQHRSICESRGFNCWSFGKLKPNKCKRKCVEALQGRFAEINPIEKNQEYEDFVKLLYFYSEDPILRKILCNKTIVQIIDNSESIDEMLSLIKDYEIKRESYDKLIFFLKFYMSLKHDKLSYTFLKKLKEGSIDDFKRKIKCF